MGTIHYIVDHNNKTVLCIGKAYWIAGPYAPGTMGPPRGHRSQLRSKWVRAIDLDNDLYRHLLEYRENIALWLDQCERDIGLLTGDYNVQLLLESRMSHEEYTWEDDSGEPLEDWTCYDAQKPEDEGWLSWPPKT